MNFHPKFQTLFTKVELDFLLSHCSIYQTTVEDDLIDYMYFSTIDDFKAEIRMDIDKDNEVRIYDLGSYSCDDIVFLDKHTLFSSLELSTPVELKMIEVT